MADVEQQFWLKVESRGGQSSEKMAIAEQLIIKSYATDPPLASDIELKSKKQMNC